MSLYWLVVLVSCQMKKLVFFVFFLFFFSISEYLFGKVVGGEIFLMLIFEQNVEA